MINSNIQWTDHTWNIARGCTKVDEDCKYCYMYRGSLDGTRYDPKKAVRTKTVFNMPLKLKEKNSNVWAGNPLVFTSSLTDVMLPEIDPYRKEMWQIIKACPHLTFQILTKRPERIDLCLWNEQIDADNWIQHRNMDNVWIGTSIGSQKSIGRMHELIDSHWKGLKFLSLEPLHGEIDLLSSVCPDCRCAKFDHGIDWVIVGGESGNDNGKYRYRECKIEWIEKIITDCRQSMIPCFVKQLGTHLAKKLNLKDRHGGDWNEWPEHLRIRQFPKPPTSFPK
jgi:protein gp37